MRPAILVAALILAASPALADPPPPDPALAFYPPAARAVGIEGQATIRCARDAQMKLTGCVLVSETPAGHGFGAAALALAAASPGNPKLDLPNSARLRPLDLTIAFTAHPLAIAPNLTHVPHVITNPDILQAPSPAEVEPYYPARAARNGVSGRVVLNCAVSAAGALVNCSVASESPPDEAFGAAAMHIATLFKMKPLLLDGNPVAGGRITIPINFTPP